MTRADLEQNIDAYLAIREAVGLTNGRQYQLLHDFVDYARNEAQATDAPIRPQRLSPGQTTMRQQFAASGGVPTALWS